MIALTTDTRQTQLAIAELARSLHAAPDVTPIVVDDVLDEVTAGAVRLLPEVHYAGISLIQRHNNKITVAAAAPTAAVPALIDQLQEDMSAGPCHEAARGQHVVSVRNYADESRWTKLARVILERTPVRSSLSIQLFTDQNEIGALNLYSETVDAFDDDAALQALTMAAHAAIAISGARRDAQFRSALASRDIIGQAKGMLMERYSIDALQAFRLLSRLSQDQNIPVAVIATQLVQVDHPQP